MNLHKNARTCPRSRALMVSRVLEEKRPVSEVAASMGVSRRTVSGVESSSASVIWIEVEARQEQALEYVVCVNNDGYPASLELHKIYGVLADDDAAKHGDLRVIDESGEAYLYPANYFAFIAVPEKVKASLLKAR